MYIQIYIYKYISRGVFFLISLTRPSFCLFCPLFYFCNTFKHLKYRFCGWGGILQLFFKICCTIVAAVIHYLSGIYTTFKSHFEVIKLLIDVVFKQLSHKLT